MWVHTENDGSSIIHSYVCPPRMTGTLKCRISFIRMNYPHSEKDVGIFLKGYSHEICHNFKQLYTDGQ